MHEAATVQLHAPHSLARGIQPLLAFVEAMMADLSQTTIKVTAALGVLASVLMAGIWIGSRSSDVDSLAAAQAASRDSLQQAIGRFDSKLDQINANFTLLQRDVAKLQAHEETAAQERQRLDRELRLLENYTKGRISHMPYKGEGQ